MPSIDTCVLLALAVATPAVCLHVWRRGARRGRFARLAWIGFAGVVLAVTMVAHEVDVLSRLHAGRGHDGVPWSYEFRVYALLLLGALLAGAGVRILFALPGLASGDAGARRCALGAILLSLLVVAPLVPIHAIFAVPLTMITGVALLALLGESLPAAPSPLPLAGEAPAGVGPVQPPPMR